MADYTLDTWGAFTMALDHQEEQGSNLRIVENAGITWVNVGHPSSSDIQWLEERFSFHPLALEDAVSRIQIPKIDSYDNYLFLVMHFPVFDRGARITLPAEVDIFVGTDFVVTVNKAGLDPLDDLFEECENNEKTLSSAVQRSSGHLLYRILLTLVNYCLPILGKIADNVDEIETRVFEERTKELIHEISIVRRDIIAYRRVIRPQIPVVEVLEQREYTFLQVDHQLFFGDLADHIRRIWVELEELKEVIESVGDTYDSLVDHHTNRIIRILTIISAILLPMSVISGIYGMNVTLPRGDSPFAFGIVMMAMGAIATGMLLFFWFRRWI